MVDTTFPTTFANLKTISPLGKDAFHVVMGRGNDMNAIQFPHALCCRCAGFNSRLDCAHVAANHHGDKTGADLFLADQMDVCCLDHGVGSFDGADQASGFNHTKC
jgi:hypothetical protein